MSNMMSGTSLLQGDNTVPGLKVHPEVLAVLPQIEEACKEMGLDYYPILLEFVRYDEMAEIASYGGFPRRFPHWSFGMEYEEMARGYEYNQYRISEMVINTNPCRIYCMDSNTLVDNVNVICHAIGHNDFFKNNVFFQNTDTNMLNNFANHGVRIRKYMARWGPETVTEFIDQVLRLQTLIDHNNAWKKKKFTQKEHTDQRTFRFPERLTAQSEYMDGWVNSEAYLEAERERIRIEDAKDYLNMSAAPEKDILGFLKENAPLKIWEQDIVSMLYDEAMYFAPQRLTKTLNEGWASYVDYYLLCRQGLVSLGQPTVDSSIIHYAKHKMQVLGGKWSMNPYKLGFELFLDVEDRWNKGKFGTEWDQCTDMKQRKEWDKKLGLGFEKVFELRQCYNDYTAIQEFFTPELCEKLEFFAYQEHPDGNIELASRDFKKIKKGLLARYMNGGLPDIRLTDFNHRGKGHLFLQHVYDERPLHEEYAKEVLSSIYRLWKKEVILATRDAEGAEFVYQCYGPHISNIRILPADSYEKGGV